MREKYMLCVKTVLKQSLIHGIGLFADEDIPKGTIVWKFNDLIDLVLSEEQIDSLEEASKSQILNYSFKTVNGYYVLVGDDNRFINYSKNPNIMDIDDIESPSIAIRDIKKGEELTCDYCFDHVKEKRNMI